MLEDEIKVGQMYVLAGAPRGQVYKKVEEGSILVSPEGVPHQWPVLCRRPLFEVIPHYTFKERLAIHQRLLVALDAGDGRDSENEQPELTKEYEAAVNEFCVMTNMIYYVVEHYPVSAWRGMYFKDKEEEKRVLESRAAQQWHLVRHYPNGSIKTTRRGSREALNPFIEICDEWNAKNARV